MSECLVRGITTQKPRILLIQSLPLSNIFARLLPGFKPQTFPFCGNHCHFPLSPFPHCGFSDPIPIKNPSLELLKPSKLVHMEEEFEEEEVWDMAMEKRDVNVGPKIRKQKEAASSSSSQSAPRKVPRSSLIGEQGRQSAPVNIPNWSNIHRRNYEEEEDEEDDNLPPHEWLARKMARCQISTSSVCEGAGRTLKGRDQRKVREAVLTRTGFLE